MLSVADYRMHTPLCHHAVGKTVKYAACAIEVGLKEIGARSGLQKLLPLYATTSRFRKHHRVAPASWRVRKNLSVRTFLFRCSMFIVGCSMLVPKQGHRTTNNEHRMKIRTHQRQMHPKFELPPITGHHRSNAIYP